MRLDCLHDVHEFTDMHIVQEVRTHTRSFVQRVPLTLTSLLVLSHIGQCTEMLRK